MKKYTWIVTLLILALAALFIISGKITCKSNKGKTLLNLDSIRINGEIVSVFSVASENDQYLLLSGDVSLTGTASLTAWATKIDSCNKIIWTYIEPTSPNTSRSPKAEQSSASYNYSYCMADGRTFLCGKKINSNTGNYDGLITLIDRKGNLEFSRVYSPALKNRNSLSGSFRGIIPWHGDFLVIGSTFNRNEIADWFMIIDQCGNIKMSKEIPSTEATKGFNGFSTDWIETQDGIAISKYNSSLDKSLVVMFDASLCVKREHFMNGHLTPIKPALNTSSLIELIGVEKDSRELIKIALDSSGSASRKINQKQLPNSFFLTSALRAKNGSLLIIGQQGFNNSLLHSSGDFGAWENITPYSSPEYQSGLFGHQVVTVAANGDNFIQILRLLKPIENDDNTLSESSTFIITKLKPKNEQ